MHPFQHSVSEMNPTELKKEFGRNITFWGGIDVQEFLSNARTEEVKNEVRNIIAIMSPGGGYIFSPSHNIQADIPAENLAVMYETAAKIRFN